jgi:hypothetical protein
MTATMTRPVVPVITTDMARELAAAEGVCVRPILRKVTDRASGVSEVIPIRCGSTREAVCPACAQRARVLRMQQCTEGWHRTDEPEHRDSPTPATDDLDDQAADEEEPVRRVRSTRRRFDAVDLPRMPIEDRTVGRVFRSPDGQEYRPSMFLTLTLPSYGPVQRSGAPRDPGSYNYRRAALDAVFFSRLVDRFWQNLRRCAGYKVQYFSAVEPQQRLALHLHAALRGAIPRAVLRQVVAATYVQIWWPPFDTAGYTDVVPVWTGNDYADPDTGEILPTWDQALDDLDADPAARPVHVGRFGRQLDIVGIIAPSEDADRAVRYLTKYLTKSITDAHAADDGIDPAYEAHIDRLHDELRYQPCSPACANWLRYGIQPDNPGPGMIPGRCLSGAHDRENLGHAGRRVLVSRDWSGKTLTEHRADRASVVREALANAGIDAPEVDRLAAAATLPDGTPRFAWSDLTPDSQTYAHALVASVIEAQRWRAQYEAAKTLLVPVDSRSATGTGDVTAARPPPIPR